MRSVPEWIGKTPDSLPPPRVRLRVFEAHGGVCHISGRKIRAGEKWQLDHVKALINEGENRESNLAPALVAPHKEKTAEDVAEKSIINRKRQKHLGIWPKPVRKLQGRGFAKRGAAIVGGVLFLAGTLAGLYLAGQGVAKSDPLNTVNVRVNHAHRWGEPLKAGTPDFDRDGVFDCEDYAWEKLVLLLANGIAPADLALVKVTYPGEQLPHMVLVVRSGSGLRVLDNRYPMVTTPKGLERVGYRAVSGWWPQ